MCDKLHKGLIIESNRGNCYSRVQARLFLIFKDAETTRKYGKVKINHPFSRPVAPIERGDLFWLLNTNLLFIHYFDNFYDVIYCVFAIDGWTS